MVSAFLSQLLSLLGSLAALVLCVLGIVDNIKATRDNGEYQPQTRRDTYEEFNHKYFSLKKSLLNTPQ